MIPADPISATEKKTKSKGIIINCFISMAVMMHSITFTASERGYILLT